MHTVTIPPNHPSSGKQTAFVSLTGDGSSRRLIPVQARSPEYVSPDPWSVLPMNHEGYFFKGARFLFGKSEEFLCREIADLQVQTAGAPGQL